MADPSKIPSAKKIVKAIADQATLTCGNRRFDQ